MQRRKRSSGKIAVTLLILLPILLAMAGLVFDTGFGLSNHLNLQHAADAAATSAAYQLQQGNENYVDSVAQQTVQAGHRLNDANVTVNVPPSSGPYAGDANFVEVTVGYMRDSWFSFLIDGVREREIQARAVAGAASVTDGAAIVVLDPNPQGLSVAGMASLVGDLDTSEIVEATIDHLGIVDILTPALEALLLQPLESAIEQELHDCVPGLLATMVSEASSVSLPPLLTLTGGLEVEGIGYVAVEGAVLVNNEGGCVDENGDPAGNNGGIPYGIACMPLISTTELRARHIRVAGGVDHPNNYRPIDGGDPQPLQCSRLPVPNPLEDLPAPVYDTSSPSQHVVTICVGADTSDSIIDNVIDGAVPLLQPLIQSLTSPLEEKLTTITLQPGVYDSLTVLSLGGTTVFEPGVYVIRGVNPQTQLSLCIVGSVVADGVMFYIDQPGAGLGVPAALQPSVLIAPLLKPSVMKGYRGSSSPHDEMLIFQHPSDKRPILIGMHQLLSNSGLSGTIYAKQGHVSFVTGPSSYDLKIVSGTLRIVTVGNSTFAPTKLLPAATDVLLLE